MSLMDDHIRERLSGLSTNGYKQVSNCFVYQFGPYMCMTIGYENEVDQISKYNSVMRLMQHAAYVIRIVPTLKTRRELGSFIKNFLTEVSNNFPEYECREERRALIGIGVSYLNSNNNESVMTAVAPIVPYQQTLQKPEFDISASESYELMKKALQMEKNATIEEELHELLITHLGTIMAEASKTRFINDKIANLHDIIIHTPKSDYNSETYRILANIYYMEPNTEVLESELNFYGALLDIENPMDFTAFETIVGSISPSLGTEWEDPSLDEKEHDTIEKIINQTTSPNPKVDEARDRGEIPIDKPNNTTYDLNCVYNYIAMNRHIKFDTWAKRYFVTEFKKHYNDVEIINVSQLGNGAEAYELSTNLLVIPYVDLRDYQVKFIYLQKGANKPFASPDFLKEG